MTNVQVRLGEPWLAAACCKGTASCQESHAAMFEGGRVHAGQIQGSMGGRGWG